MDFTNILDKVAPNVAIVALFLWYTHKLSSRTLDLIEVHLKRAEENNMALTEAIKDFSEKSTTGYIALLSSVKSLTEKIEWWTATCPRKQEKL